MKYIIARTHEDKRYTTVLTADELSIISNFEFDEQCHPRLDEFKTERFKIIRQTPRLLDVLIDEFNTLCANKCNDVG